MIVYPFILLFLTIIIETILTIIFFKKLKFNLFYNIIAINLFSWPLANIFYSFNIPLIIIELFVFIIEGLLIKSLFYINYKKSFLLSFINNLITTLVGLLIYIF
jgi:hypothetical protein